MVKIDNFGRQISFKFNGSQIHKTNFGSILTFILISAISVRLGQLIYQGVDGQDPTVLFQERLVESPKKFIINPKTYVMALGIINSNYEYVTDDRILLIDAYTEKKKNFFNKTSNKTEQIWERVHFNLEKCTGQHVQNEDVKDYFTSNNLESHFCLPQNQEFEIEGEYNSDSFASIMINIYKCKGDQCVDKQEIDFVAQQLYLEVLFSDAYVSPQDKQQPFKHYGRDVFWESTQDLPRKVYIELRNNYVQSDFGWFWPQLQTDIFPSFSNMNEIVIYLFSLFLFKSLSINKIFEIEIMNELIL